MSNRHIKTWKHKLTTKWKHDKKVACRNGLILLVCWKCKSLINFVCMQAIVTEEEDMSCIEEILVVEWLNYNEW